MSEVRNRFEDMILGELIELARMKAAPIDSLEKQNQGLEAQLNAKNPTDAVRPVPHSSCPATKERKSDSRSLTNLPLRESIWKNSGHPRPKRIRGRDRARIGLPSVLRRIVDRLMALCAKRWFDEDTDCEGDEDTNRKLCNELMDLLVTAKLFVLVYRDGVEGNRNASEQELRDDAEPAECVNVSETTF